MAEIEVRDKYAGENTLESMLLKLKIALSAKVNVETGKGLSSNDYTTADKNKLSELVKITIDSILSETSVNPVQNSVITAALKNKADLVSPDLIGNPTAPTQAANDSSTLIATTAFVANAISKALEGVTGIDFVVLQVGEVLPSTGEKGKFYLKPLVAPESETNVYEEYVWVNNKWELIGTTSVDLSNYVKFTDLVDYVKNTDLQEILANYLLKSEVEEITAEEVTELWNSVFDN